MQDVNFEALLSIKETESTEDYKKRCYTLKLRDNIVSWEELKSIMNRNMPENPDYTESKFRKEAKKWEEEGILDFSLYQDVLLDNTEFPVSSHDIQFLNKLKKEKYKLAEERTQINAYIRKLAREETIKEIAEDFASKMSSKKILSSPITIDENLGDHQGILCLSDWHYGIEINNYFNVYNPDICRKRVSKLRDKVIYLGHKEGIKLLHIVNLSDLIAGRIHLTLRLESREDVISQTMEVSELLAEFISDLSQHFKIEYRDVLDNHSRLEPNKKDSIELETLARIIPWYLSSRLKDNDNVSILNNSYADDIIDFKVFDHNVAAVHGHKDKLNKVVQNMTSMTRRRNDLVLSAHFHHFSADEENECIRISNGSLMGTDTYSQDLRLTSKPSQNLIISSREDVAEVIYKISLV